MRVSVLRSQDLGCEYSILHFKQGRQFNVWTEAHGACTGEGRPPILPQGQKLRPASSPLGQCSAHTSLRGKQTQPEAAAAPSCARACEGITTAEVYPELAELAPGISHTLITSNPLTTSGLRMPPFSCEKPKDREG